MRGEARKVGADCGSDVTAGDLGPVPHPCAFHLVEDRVVAAVDGVSAIDICGDEETIGEVGAECVCLVGGGMGAQDSGGVDIVRVGLAAAWMVGGEAERIEILRRGDDGIEMVVVAVGWGGEF